MKTIRTKLYVVYGVFALMSVVGIAVTLIYFGNYLTNTALNKELDTAAAGVKTRIAVIERLAKSMVDMIATNPDIVKAFAAGNRAELERMTVPIFKKMKKEVQLKQFQFHLPPATSFLRVHKPVKFGDDLSSFRHTVVAVNKSKKRVAGIEKGRFGYGMRAVVPISHEGRHVGSVEMGMGLNGAIKKFTEKTGVEVVLYQKTQAGIGDKIISTFNKDFKKTGLVGQKFENKPKNILETKALGGNHAMSVFTLNDYSGKPAMAVAIGVDRSKFDATGRNIIYVAAILGLFAIIGNLVIFYWLDRAIFTRFSKLTGQISSLASGNRDVEPENTGVEDEIAQMAEAVTVLRDNAREQKRLEEEQARGGEHERERQNKIESLIDDFRSTATAGLEKMAANAAHMDGTAKELTVAAEGSHESSNIASLAAGEASQNVQSVAAAAEELSAAIAEVSRQIHLTDEMVERTADMARDADGKVSNLAENAVKIDEVLTLIRDIAEQTNLLALNATIEAARAGEAGKGFAVVASEVKELATQTAKATDEISKRINDIQIGTETSVSAIRAIADNMAELANNTTAISAAAEEQGATTNEISGNITSAADRTQSVADSVAKMDSTIASTSDSAIQVLANAGSVASEVDQLSATVERFLEGVKAA